MEQNLTEKHCVPCEGGMPPLTEEQIAKLMPLLGTGWYLEQGKLLKPFSFKDFKSALEFVNKVGAIAESEGHHPDIALGWGKATITLWTHALGGLSENDFILAAKIDQVLLVDPVKPQE